MKFTKALRDTLRKWPIHCSQCLAPRCPAHRKHLEQLAGAGYVIANEDDCTYGLTGSGDLAAGALELSMREYDALEQLCGSDAGLLESELCNAGPATLAALRDWDLVVRDPETLKYSITDTGAELYTERKRLEAIER